MTGCYQLMITGPLSRSASTAITDRFAGVSITRCATDTVVRIRDADQAALRALLTLVWDVGHDVLSLVPAESS
jgi:hypothetical protein